MKLLRWPETIVTYFCTREYCENSRYKVDDK